MENALYIASPFPTSGLGYFSIKFENLTFEREEIL
jgi:hypothetical protein